MVFFGLGSDTPPPSDSESFQDALSDGRPPTGDHCYQHDKPRRCRREPGCGWRDDLGCRDLSHLSDPERRLWERQGARCDRLRKPDCLRERSRCHWVTGEGCRGGDAPRGETSHRARVLAEARKDTRILARRLRDLARDRDGGTIDAIMAEIRAAMNNLRRLRRKYEKSH